MEFDGQKRLAALQAAGTDPRRQHWILARWGVFFLLGFTMACARVLETGGPFGMALVAAAGPGGAGVAALLGASLGYLVTGGLDWSLRYMAACVLVYTVSYVFQDQPLARERLFMPAAAAAVMVMTGWLGSFAYETAPRPLWAELFLEASLAFGGCYFFREALSGGLRTTETEELQHSVSLMILAACLLMTLSRLTLLDTISVGRLLALLLVMTAAMKGGMLTGAAMGTLLGMAVDIARPGVPFYTMAYAFCGLLSGIFGRHGRFLFVLSFLLADALAVVSAWTSRVYTGALIECFCASVLFLLLPGNVLAQMGGLFQVTERGGGESGLRRFAASRIRGLGEAYADLVQVVQEGLEEPYNEENVSRVFDRATDAVCAACQHKNRCWNAEYMDTLSAMNDATAAMKERGSLNREDLPAHFRERCTGLDAFVAAVNGELRALNYRRELRARLEEERHAAWGQYADISQVLGRVAAELGSPNGPDPLAERRLLRYLRSLDLDAETAVYRDGRGRLRVVIESGRLTPLTRQEDYLEKLSQVVGVRLCRPSEEREASSRLTLLEAEPLAVSVGVAALKKKGERVSGDRGSYFKTEAGVLCVILADGMGAGDEAARDSARVVEILEKFLRSGADPAVAMKILNSVLLLRGGDNWGFTTVDLMCVDLFTGETCFYKYGAAPSYVKSGRQIRRVKGESLAAGLASQEGAAPDVVRLRLQPGSTALIASDGVVADPEDGWVKDLLSQEQTDMKRLARTVLREAEELYGAGDDMTVLALRVEERL